MSLIEDIKRDRESGTPDQWNVSGARSSFQGKGHQINAPSLAGVAWIGYESDHHAACLSDARRIARVPDMEAALIAADELKKTAKLLAAIMQSEMTRQGGKPFSGTWTIPSMGESATCNEVLDRIDTALGNFSAATGAA